MRHKILDRNNKLTYKPDFVKYHESNLKIKRENGEAERDKHADFINRWMKQAVKG